MCVQFKYIYIYICVYKENIKKDDPWHGLQCLAHCHAPAQRWLPLGLHTALMVPSQGPQPSQPPGRRLSHHTNSHIKSHPTGLRNQGMEKDVRKGRKLCCKRGKMYQNAGKSVCKTGCT